MFKVILAVAITVVSFQVKAEAEVLESHGTSLVQDLGDNESFIEIKGKSAKQLFDQMSADLISAVDASENNGVRSVLKIGSSMTCAQYIELGQTDTYDCTIIVVNNLKGKIGKGQ